MTLEALKLYIQNKTCERSYKLCPPKTSQHMHCNGVHDQGKHQLLQEGQGRSVAAILRATSVKLFQRVVEYMENDHQIWLK